VTATDKIEKARWDQTWRAFWVCAHVSLEEMKERADEAIAQLDSNAHWDSSTRLQAMVKVYTECAKELEAIESRCTAWLAEERPTKPWGS
jgi:hypothetical protein